MLQTLLHHLYPDLCPGCATIVQSADALCPECWADTPFIVGPACNTCGMQLVGEDEGDDLICDDCLADPRDWNRGRATFMYDGAARSMILGLKHGDRHDLIGPLVAWTAAKADDLLQVETVFVPVPLHPFRLLKRKYNQAALIAAGLATSFDRPVVQKALIRRKRTPSLDGKTRNDRRATLLDAIVGNPKQADSIRNKHVILVDDVMTSGATLTACTHAIQQIGADHVDVLTLARVGKSP